MGAPDLWDAVLALEPGSPAKFIGEERIEDVALAFADFADMKAAHKAGHSRRTAAVAGSIAERMGLPESLVATVRHAALVHDIGEVGVPGSILAKEGPLDQWEMEQVRLHPHYTERILSRVPSLRPVATIAGAHHEWMTGRAIIVGCRAPRYPLVHVFWP